VITRVRNPPGVGRVTLRSNTRLTGSADVPSSADHLLEEDTPHDRLVEHLGERKLSLQNGQVVAIARGTIPCCPPQIVLRSLRAPFVRGS